MKFLEFLAAKFLESRIKGFAVNLKVSDPWEDPRGYIYGSGWHINFGSSVEIPSSPRKRELYKKV